MRLASRQRRDKLTCAHQRSRGLSRKRREPRRLQPGGLIGLSSYIPYSPSNTRTHGLLIEKSRIASLGTTLTPFPSLKLARIRIFPLTKIPVQYIWKKGAPIRHRMTVTPSELAAVGCSGEISFVQPGVPLCFPSRRNRRRSHIMLFQNDLLAPVRSELQVRSYFGAEALSAALEMLPDESGCAADLHPLDMGSQWNRAASSLRAT